MAKRPELQPGDPEPSESAPVELVPFDTRWAAGFRDEAGRIESALDPLTDGGLLESIEHIGSTAVPGLSAKPCIDIMAATWPFPLPDHAVSALCALGYDYRGENGIPGRQYFSRGLHRFHLHVVSADSDFWIEHLLFRDYLRARPEAAREYEALKLSLSARHRRQRRHYLEGKAPLISRLMDEARAWYREEVGFDSLRQQLSPLAGLSIPWQVSSGWAIDLYLARVTRLHHDLDVAVFREDQLPLRSFLEGNGWKLLVPHECRLEAWPAGVQLELPRHQIHAHRKGRFIDFLLNERSDSSWRFRRETAIVRSLERMTLATEDGVRYLAPEVVLLFKSKYAGDAERGKDQADFENVMAAGLEAERRQWLRRALKLHSPGHPWLARLA